MSTQKRKNQTGEPTTNGGHFAKAAERAEGDATLSGPTPDDILWDGFTAPGDGYTAYFSADGRRGLLRDDVVESTLRDNPGARLAVLTPREPKKFTFTPVDPSEPTVWPAPGYTEVVYPGGEHGSVPDKDVEAFLRDFEGSRLPGPLPLPNPPIEGNVIVDLEGGYQASVEPLDIDSFRGLTKSGNQVIAMSKNAAGTESLLTLTICCNVAAGANEYGLECKRCFAEVPLDLEDDPIIAYARV